MLPPKSCWMPAPNAPTTLRERTMIPRTRPRLRTMREPSTVNAVVTHSLWTSGAACIGYIAIALPPSEFGFLLGEEAHDPDRGVVTESRPRKVAGLDLERLIQRQVVAAPDRVLDHGDGEGRRLRQARRTFVHGFRKVVWCDGLVDPAH